MEIPKFHETFIPILKVLENGETLQAREMYQMVIDRFFNKFIIIVFCFISLSIKAQTEDLPIDPNTGLITYTEVVTLKDSVTKDELFSRSKSSFALIFNDAQEVIQNEDKDAGIIIGKGVIKANAKLFGISAPGGYVNFTITLASKDNRYKYTLTNFYHEGTGSNMPSGGNLENSNAPSWTKKQWNTMKSEINSNVQNLITSIKREMGKSPISDDW